MRPLRQRLLTSRWVRALIAKGRSHAKLMRAMRWGGKDAVPGHCVGAEAPALKENLVLQESSVEQIFTIPGAFTEEEAASLVSRAESQGFELQTSRGPAYGEAERHHYRLSFDDATYAAGLWNTLRRSLESLRVKGRGPVGLNENIRIYKYLGGDVFGKHIDGSNATALGRTEYTLLVYLTGREEGLEGGETVFYSLSEVEVLRVTPQAGMALVHRHGHGRCLLHESLPVRKGVKYVLRSDVVFEH